MILGGAMLEVRGSSVLRSAGSGVPPDTGDIIQQAFVPNQRPLVLPASQSHRTLLKGSSLQRTSAGQALTVDALLAAAVVSDNSTVALTHIANTLNQRTGVGFIADTAISLTATASSQIADPRSTPYSADKWSLGTTDKDSRPLMCGSAEFRCGPDAGPAPERKSSAEANLSTASRLNAASAAAATVASARTGSSGHLMMAPTPPPSLPSQPVMATSSSSSISLSPMPSSNVLEEGSGQPPLHTSPAQPCTNALSQCTSLPLHHQPSTPLLHEQQQQLNRSTSAVSSSCSSTASRGGISSFGSSSWGSSTGNSDFLGSSTGSGCGASNNSNGSSWLSMKGGGIGAGYGGGRARCGARVTSSRGGTTTRTSLPVAAQGQGGVSAMRHSTNGATAAASCGTGGGSSTGGSYSNRSILRDGIGVPPVAPLGFIDMHSFGCNNNNSSSSSLRGSSRPASALLEPLKREEGPSRGESVGAVAAGASAPSMAAVLATATSASAPAPTHDPRPELAESMRQRAAPTPPNGCNRNCGGSDGGDSDGDSGSDVRGPSSCEAGSRSASVLRRRVATDRPSASSTGIQEARSKVLPVSSSPPPLKPVVTGGVASVGASRGPAAPPRQRVCAGKGSTSQKRQDVSGNERDDIDNARAGADAAEATGENTSQARALRTATQRSRSSSGSPKRSRNTRRSSSGGCGSGGGSTRAVSSSGATGRSNSSTRQPRRGRRSSSKQLLKSSGSSLVAGGMGVGTTALPRSRSCTPCSSPRGSAANSLSGSCQLQLTGRTKSGSTLIAAAAEAPSRPAAAADAAPRLRNPGSTPHAYFRSAPPGAAYCASGRYNLATVYGLGAKSGDGGGKVAVSTRAPMQGQLACADTVATGAATPLNIQAVNAGSGSDREHPLSCPLPIKPTTASPPPLLLSRVSVRTPEPSVPPLLSSNNNGSGGPVAAETLSLHGSSIATSAAATVATVLAVANPTQGLRLCIGSAGAAVGPAHVAETTAAGPVRSASFGLQSAPHSPRSGGSAAAIGQVASANGSSSSWRPSLEPLPCSSSGRYPHDLTANSAAAAAMGPGLLGTQPSVERYWSSEQQRRRTASSFTGDGGGAAADPPPGRSSPPRLQPLETVTAVPLPTHVADGGGAGGSPSVGLPSLHFPPKPPHLAPLQSHRQPDAAGGPVGLAASSRVSTHVRDLPSLEEPQPHHPQQNHQIHQNHQQQQQHMQDMSELGPASRGSDSNGHASTLHVGPAPFPTTPLDWRKPSPQPLQFKSLQPGGDGGLSHFAAATATGGSNGVGGAGSGVIGATAATFVVSGSAAHMTGSTASKGGNNGGGGTVSPCRRRVQRHTAASPGRLYHTQPLPGPAAGSFGGVDTDGGESGRGSSGGGAVSNRVNIASMTVRETSDHVRKAQERLEAYSRAQKEKARAAEAEEVARRQRQAEERNRHVAQRERRRVEVYALNALLARCEAARTQQLIEAMAKAGKGRENQPQRQIHQQSLDLSETRSVAGGSDSDDSGDSDGEDDEDGEGDGATGGGRGGRSDVQRGGGKVARPAAAEFLRHGV
ncbi:hypothetical protein Vretimale_7539 [Volvox reticuliferus]|uniref:Uncharacterized protein n=1 Tax=Volvox reticuliferus TaxID=1737510 RepID=A0A8J4G938_9CHLO|nr:hypothetical protein Vretifemale_7537 [Volvox reticuliferus]GIM02690.1 hypothetical protein Vretimale_7539 [Volvox reticuliferus]